MKKHKLMPVFFAVLLSGCSVGSSQVPQMGESGTDGLYECVYFNTDRGTVLYIIDDENDKSAPVIVYETDFDFTEFQSGDLVTVQFGLIQQTDPPQTKAVYSVELRESYGDYQMDKDILADMKDRGIEIIWEEVQK